MSVTLADGRLRVRSDGSGYSTFVKRIDPHDYYIPFPMSVPEPIENPVQPAHSVPLVFSVDALGSADSREAVVGINVFHCVHGHANELMLRKKVKSLGVELLGDFRPCTGCSVAKGYRKPIAKSTKSRATQKLGEVLSISVGLRASIRQGKRYVIIMKNDFTRYSWVYFLEHKYDAAEAFKKLLADVRMVCRWR